MQPEISTGAVQPVSLGNRLAAQLAAFGSAPKSLAGSAEALGCGQAAQARRLAEGRLLFAGAMVDAPGRSPWDIPPPTRLFSKALHGFDWLDDLGGTADPTVAETLRAWVHDWVARHGKGDGPGWHPDVTGRRLLNWGCHAQMIVKEANARQSRAFLRSFARQARFLRRRWHYAPSGLPRFEAAAGLVHAGIALEGAGGILIRTGIDALARISALDISDDGGLESRNPEEIGALLSVLVWVRLSLDQKGLGVSPLQNVAIARLAGAIRTLRHDDGALARFHGGGAGEAERLDRALSLSQCRPGPRGESVMGLHRLSSGRTVIFLDGGVEARNASSPSGSETRHASSLCLEMSAGRGPMIVSVGPGTRFGPRWALAARATAAHSGLTVAETSSARVSASGILPYGVPRTRIKRAQDAEGVRLTGEHDGWLSSHGLMYQRRLSLSADGSMVMGEDRLCSEEKGPRALFDQVRAACGEKGVPFAIRFHLHPDVEVDTFLAGSAIHLQPSPDMNWIMRQTGGVASIEQGIFVDETGFSPRATKQIVVRAYATDYTSVVKWSFHRAGPQRLVGAVVRD